MKENQTKKCPQCQTDIPLKAKKCPQCQTDLRGFISRHPILTVIAVPFIAAVTIATSSMDTESINNSESVLSQEELAAWAKSPSGKLCGEHPEWKKEECDLLITKNIWIGMSYEQIVYLRGTPNTVNPSNYGNGIKYQYCWTGHTPSCFYDNDGDGSMDSYN